VIEPHDRERILLGAHGEIVLPQELRGAGAAGCCRNCALPVLASLSASTLMEGEAHPKAGASPQLVDHGLSGCGSLVPDCCQTLRLWAPFTPITSNELITGFAGVWPTAAPTGSNLSTQSGRSRPHFAGDDMSSGLKKRPWATSKRRTQEFGRDPRLPTNDAVRAGWTTSSGWIWGATGG